MDMKNAVTNVKSNTDESSVGGNRYALCIGIGKYKYLTNHDLRFATSDAEDIAKLLQDPERGNFQVTLLTQPHETTKEVLENHLDRILNAPNLKSNDIVLIYLSCHGGVRGNGNKFYLLPADANLKEDGSPYTSMIIDVYDLAKNLSDTKAENIILLLDACYSGGAGRVLQYLDLISDLEVNTNLFIIGAARHDQKAIQSSKQRHGLFTSCLLQALEQKPQRNDGWLTISEVYSFMTDTIKTYEMTDSLQIQSVSFNVNPNLPIAKNPYYSPKNVDFYERVKKTLSLVQYEPIKKELNNYYPGFYVATIKAGLRASMVAVVPYYNQVEALTIEKAKQICLFFNDISKIENFDYCIIVTSLVINNDVKEFIKYEANNLIQVESYDSIWQKIIDFSSYLNKLIDQYENQGRYDNKLSIAQIYIKLYAERRRYPIKSFGVEMFGTKTVINDIDYDIAWEGDLEKEVERWLLDNTTSRLAILADYGSGKTTFCYHLTKTLAQNFLNQANRRPYEYRIPLLIPLLDFAKAPFDLESFIIAYLRRYCRVDNPNFDALIKMAEEGLLVFIFDGFDEMATRANNSTLQKNILLFDQLALLGKNKVIITTRPEYFINISQETRILQSYSRLYLKPFNEDQIDLYLQKRIPLLESPTESKAKDWKFYRQKMKEIHDLSDLARRPVLLEMIIKTLPVLIAEGKAINRLNLYQSYLEGELERQRLKQRHDILIDTEKRFEIMERIAFELYITNKAEIDSSRILELSKDLLDLDQQEELQGSLREILTCSFLTRDNNAYRFSHQSFIEYLISSYLAKDIFNDYKERIQKKVITDQVLGFLAEFINMGQKDIDLHSSTHLSRKEFICNKLIKWVEADNRNRWVSSNAISILGKTLSHKKFSKLPLRKAILSNANLSGVDLTGADLTGADLTGADLTGADLTGADLTGANLNSVNLSRATLCDAKLISANLSRAILSYADLSGANLKLSDLSFSILGFSNLMDSNLRYAILYNTDLSSTNLSRVDLFGATLSNTNLSGADLSFLNLRSASLQNAILYEANLYKSDLSGVYLSGADLRYADLSYANLKGSKLHRATLKRADFSGANLSNADLYEADCEGAYLIDVNLRGSDLGKANLSSVYLSGSHLEKFDLENICLYEADLSEANLSEANLSKANLSKADLSKADLSKTNLSEANLSEANLSEANLSEANLSEANLNDATLIAANLHGTILVRAHLTNANLSEAKLVGTDLSYADLAYANISDVDFGEAIQVGTDFSKVDIRNCMFNTIDLDSAIVTGEEDQKNLMEKYKIKLEEIEWEMQYYANYASEMETQYYASHAPDTEIQYYDEEPDIEQ